MPLSDAERLKSDEVIASAYGDKKRTAAALEAANAVARDAAQADAEAQAALDAALKGRADAETDR